MRLLVLAVALLALAACGDERNGPGMVLTADGRMVENSPAVARAEAEQAIRTSVVQALGPVWRAEVAIAEDPVYLRDKFGSGDWVWPACTATVVLHGPGTPPVALTELQAGIERYLAGKRRRSSDPLRVLVTLGAPVPPTSASAPAPAAERSYTIQSGDTLADISTVFYGGPERWRDILAANPGLTADRLEPGRRVVIPAK